MKRKAIMPVLLSQMVGLPALLIILLMSGLTVGLFYPTASCAAGCPQFTTLGGLTDRTFEPVRVAVSDSGDAYVTDWFNGNLKVFNYKGGLLKTKSIDPANHTGLDNTGPLGVAVDSTGRIYVGRADVKSGVFTGEVTVYNANLTPVIVGGYPFKLGRGYGEFQYPGAIATDAERVYVTDSHSNIVKVYDKTTGGFLFSFGGYAPPYDIGGSQYRYDYQPGYLVSPSGIAVDSATGEIYVTDRALYCSLDTSMQSGGTCGSSSSYTGGSGSATWGMGAGIHVFRLSEDKTSVTMVRRLGEFSTYLSEGKLYQPGAIAISGDVVIVSDVLSGTLHVFDATSGVAISPCLKSVGAQPTGLAVGDDGRLLVATKGGVGVYGLDNYVKMAVTPDPLLVDSKQCTSEPVTATMTIYNDGPGVLNWEISEDIPWLTPSVTSGAIDGMTADKSDSVPVVVNLSGTELSNIYEGSIVVRAQGEVENVEVKVRLSVPALTVTPDVLFFNIDGTTAPQPKTLNIKLSTDTSGGLTWNAFSDSAWMTVTPSGPSGALAIANVSIDTAKLDEIGGAEHVGYLTVTAGCATGSPSVIPVKVTGQIAKGTLQVTTNIPAAPITITGSSTVAAVTATGSPHAYSINLPEGSYTVTFGGVAGFKAPAPQVVSIVAGSFGEASGDYLDLREKLNVITTMGSGQWYVADEIKVYDGSGTLASSLVLASATRTRTGMREGRTTASGDVDGDGVDDIVIASDKGAISAIKADGTPISGLNFTAFSYGTGVNLAVADIDGDGAGEIIVGAGEKAGNPAVLRVFSYSGGKVLDTGINLIAHEEMYGVKVAAGDVDGDGIMDIATVPGGGGSAPVRLWRINTSGGKGAWKAVDAGGFSTGPSALSPAVSVADVDADSVDEVIVARGAAPANGSATIAAYKADGTKVLEFSIDAKGPIAIAAGDTDMDGIADVVVGENSAQSSSPAPSIVRIYKNGVLGKEFPAFSSGDIYGVRVSLGRIGGAR